MEAPSELWRSDAYRYEACGCNNFEQWPRDAATGCLCVPKASPDSGSKTLGIDAIDATRKYTVGRMFLLQNDIQQVSTAPGTRTWTARLSPRAAGRGRW